MRLKMNERTTRAFENVNKGYIDKVVSKFLTSIDAKCPSVRGPVITGTLSLLSSALGL